ncbi:MAG TPA: carboxypeptidase-like regulatory domain-containing protein, partial [Candidatus Saccharimonadales bacterium]|nr:carboxypeptidase-like regulatory domain-containing protein [Candidatus Saccharimonadales bacterium]
MRRHCWLLPLSIWIVVLVRFPVFSVGAAGPSGSSLRTNGFTILDLSPVAAPSGAEASKRFGMLQEGLQMRDGVPFKIGERVAVTGLESSQAGDIYPSEVSLPVTGKFKRLHILHSTLNFAKDGTPIAAFKIHYASGAEESLRIGYGVHVRSYVRSGMEKKDVLVDPNTRPLQIGMESGDPQSGARFYHTVLDNPRPEEAVARIELQSFFSRATPVLLAATLEKEGSGLPASYQAARRKGFKDLREYPDTVYRRELTVRATASSGGAVLTNATASLSVSDDTHTYFVGESHADPQGICKIPFPPNQTMAFNLLVRAPGFIPSVISQSRTNRPDLKTDFTAALDRGVAIGGLVKSEDGKPVAGAEVLVFKVVKSGPRDYSRTDYDVARTDATGKWSSSSLPE